MAQEAAPREVGCSNSRRLLAQNQLCNCADAQVGESDLFYKASNRKGAPKRRGPAKILDVDDAAATVKFRSQTFKAARHSPGGEKDVQDFGGVDGNPAPGSRIHQTACLRRS